MRKTLTTLIILGTTMASAHATSKLSLDMVAGTMMPLDGMIATGVNANAADMNNSCENNGTIDAMLASLAELEASRAEMLKVYNSFKFFSNPPTDEEARAYKASRDIVPSLVAIENEMNVRLAMINDLLIACGLPPRAPTWKPYWHH